MDDPIHIGPFDVGDRLGEGGMGAVYRGEHGNTGVPVAIKVIRRESGADARWRFHQEVQAHANLLLGTAPESILARLDDLRRRAERAGSRRLVAIAWRQTSYCRQDMGRWNEAAEAIPEATRAAKASGDVTVLVDALLQRGWLAFFLGELDEAQE